MSESDDFGPPEMAEVIPLTSARPTEPPRWYKRDPKAAWAEVDASWRGISRDWMAHELELACQGRPMQGAGDCVSRARIAYRKEQEARQAGRPPPSWVGALGRALRQMDAIVKRLPEDRPYEERLAEARRMAESALQDPHHGAPDRRTGERP